MHPPSIDRLARAHAGSGLPHPTLVGLARRVVAEVPADQVEGVLDSAVAKRVALEAREVINGTGVLLHTNLGRSPVSASGNDRYTNLEFSLADGGRGPRAAAVTDLATMLTGAEAALVVNNCAAAVMLALATLANERGVIVSRGELVEIGGGFRVPDVLAQSGATLVEVGTTNRTNVGDLVAALESNGGAADPPVAMVLKVHQSNYRIIGFTESVSVAQAREAAPDEVVVMADLGSGLLDARCQWLPGGPPSWLGDEPGVAQVLADGADLVAVSGDKLMGGPQAGLLVGRADLVDRCARNPLMRAVRCGGGTLRMLERTLTAYANRDLDGLPFWSLATTTCDALRQRGASILTQLPNDRSVEMIDTVATTGGGTLPGADIASVGLALPGDRVAALRASEPPVIARAAEGTTVIDLRTVFSDQDAPVTAALARLLDRTRA
ncbi:L-seryl-tRNA(Sec) selenium transferase [Candidatus Neomicrothrix sp.]|uniref:L-seryl-tRNA(Sec) selenium transferase n=1 Tax=Candidatus Neomicrothrix sp. TaxID=2719034 RepID=UPI001B54E19A|nr:L-seryl-tRNA(Sec) selenium transferase [Candidatus Microthrix sp.]MBK6504006.1 L-seryl-tRNA(Sec) selenium transferase [Candidatus Microthrix sp.]MBP7404919.1 L-seryl-tRNA(Sec) selenium transferase [Candidatus Microthrix sp.]MBP7853504.1 L-seryl-tRNA(Sec) selenium transferase [Candidatus Microthrix sp.]MBP7879146.1 L-seryl-tRNA(Sec) selenium transferase [Candidatus Microthrix sp.]MBP7993719.1 L-seryl-tRNA(Sec) selenium transferase [Candidatus Microthrix sp.]